MTAVLTELGLNLEKMELISLETVAELVQLIHEENIF